MGRSHQRSVPLFIENLEDRRLLAANVISGFVFNDLNGNGLRDAGETVIANNLIELRNSANVVVGSTTTDTNGFYNFSTDNTISQAVQTQVQTVNFANGKANTIVSQLLSQFDPSLGTLQSIQIKVDGRIISDIKLENLDDESSVVSGTVSGNVLLSGPGFNLNVNIAGNAAISKTLPAFDGTIDFGGTSGVSLGSTTATGSNTQTLIGSAMSSYIGTGTVNLSFLAQASTQASGGGNLTANITNQGGGTVTVTYSYIKNNDLKPGNYKIIQKVQPAGLLDGRDSQAGGIVANSFNTDSLNVTLNNTDSTDNNFGEYEPASLKGYVYADNNNNGIREATEVVFANIKVKLTGTDDRGAAINLTISTDANGLYSFGNLRPGKYTITESTLPTGYNAGKITAGSLGGTLATTRTINNITTPVGSAGVDNNFGHLAIKPPSSSGPTGPVKGLLLGSTPKPTPVTPPDSSSTTTTGPVKGLLLGSTPKPSTVNPPASGSTTTTTGPVKGLLLGSTPKPTTVNPPASGSTTTTAGPVKGLLLGSTPSTTTANTSLRRF
ncbi:MAG TPA: choice-of-anchor E domain-containing protein [Gemmatales bacterium]|nr:choice-of-anchor E domain-containing protein [Gemmatales bacterium]